MKDSSPKTAEEILRRIGNGVISKSIAIKAMEEFRSLSLPAVAEFSDRIYSGFVETQNKINELVELNTALAESYSKLQVLYGEKCAELNKLKEALSLPAEELSEKQPLKIKELQDQLASVQENLDLCEAVFRQILKEDSLSMIATIIGNYYFDKNPTRPYIPYWGTRTTECKCDACNKLRQDYQDSLTRKSPAVESKSEGTYEKT